MEILLDQQSNPSTHLDLIFVNFNILKLLLAKTCNFLSFSIV